MADGEIKVTLDTDTERRLRAVADAAGRSVDEYLKALIAEDLSFDGMEDERIAKASDEAGDWRTAEEAVSHFRAALHERAKKAR